VTLLGGAIFGYLSRSSGDSDSGGSGDDPHGAAIRAADEEGALVIAFKDTAASRGGKAQAIHATSGTLVRVRLLNTLETFDTVPAFVQVVDHSLGSSFYGWTLIGDASGEGDSGRIKMNFRTLRSPKGNTSRELNGQALSLDGRLGIRAQKSENFTNRAFIGSGKGAAGGLSGSGNSSGDLASLLVRTLLRGLETEMSADLGTAYKNAVTLKLSSGHEFFVQLTESF